MKSLNKPKLAKELAIVLLIKVFLLTLLWSVFVRNHEVTVDAEKVSQSFGFQSQVSDQLQGANHDKR
ncbi:hypothetical protein LHV13_04740 [Ferrovum sp. PN-J185]|uniref:cytochrome oxidase putative small subunit CydP n=1 Tax=Ferrovum sp. PN-J185 TaxID=1356306 RepID=UPI000798D693|nr:cytochrome oxidase putative small subunit CydP [Ferrovum sp. PN-J185]KXW55329.1 hypothetical protein FV185_15750 [Ferrovum sp. PN-J185]MCC6068483.1 hypothetical protein [Ferrovum sp. PN-J185]MDE1892541.1 hypothetical protein [Betaproteobacteria bacterium]MDE2056888.1 hypothetical protein [Betaproteobacteria bacterium]